MEKNSRINETNKQIILFGKSFKSVKASSVKSNDFLDAYHREFLDDLIYSKERYSKEEITRMPVMRQYRINVLAEKTDKILYNWKRQLINEMVDNLLLSMFHKSKIVKQLVDKCKENQVGMDVTKINIHTLVSEKDIVLHLQKKGIFPKVKV
jgi:hypothetical protein